MGFIMIAEIYIEGFCTAQKPPVNHNKIIKDIPASGKVFFGLEARGVFQYNTSLQLPF